MFRKNILDRYFTKSLFKLALECPTKLYYFGKPEYKNELEEDSFLEGLKEGGYQVGALAKSYIDGGIDLANCSNEQAHQQTLELLTQNNVIIYEPLIRSENMQVRCDILVKKNDKIEIIEVKSKSFCEEDDCNYRDSHGQVISEFRNKKDGSIISDWKEYLLDVAFQSHVLERAMPSHLKITYCLMLIDKDQICPVDGLNQKFIISGEQDGKKPKIIVKPLIMEDKATWILKKINVDQHIKELKSKTYTIGSMEMNFDLYLKHLADNYVSNTKLIPLLGSKCRKCEFKSSFSEEANGLKSGFRECWKLALNWKDSDFEDKTVLDLWQLRSKDKLIEQGKTKLDDLSIEDIKPKDEKTSLSQSARQWLQVQKYQKRDENVFIHSTLKDEMSNWVFPLHFIDFETCTVAIPFHKGHKPYKPIAFQYSHHIMHENGQIEHKGEYLETRPGVFPNYDFVRALKRELETDEGTIFRFHNHENTILNAIYDQLIIDPANIPDKNDLMNFIESITVKKNKNERKSIRNGKKNMVDLEEILRKYTFFPSTGGKTSMKVTLPAIFNFSQSLQEKYIQPIYGSDNGIKSHNFNNWCVVEKDTSAKIIDPYLRLPGVFENVPHEDIELFQKAERMREITDIREGGMASIAYAMLQFSNIAEVERQALATSLRKYCELDTLGMVILYEFLQEKINFQ